MKPRALPVLPALLVLACGPYAFAASSTDNILMEEMRDKAPELRQSR